MHGISGALVYHFGGPIVDKIEVIMSWSASDTNKVYTQITDSSDKIDWDVIKEKLEKTGLTSEETKDGIKVTMAIDFDAKLFSLSSLSLAAYFIDDPSRCITITEGAFIVVSSPCITIIASLFQI